MRLIKNMEEKMKKLMVTFLLTIFVTLLLAQATDLFISEYVEGSSYHKAIEIFNGTGAPVDLSIYSLKKQTNGAGEFDNELALSGTLENDDVFVIVYDHGGDGDLTGEAFVDMATTQQTLSFNGNDAVALCKNGDLLDVVGVVDSSSDWGKNMTLVRHDYVAAPTTTYVVDEWIQYPSDTFDYLGYHDFTGGTEPVIIVTSPNGGEQWEQGSTHNITWSSVNYTDNVTIELNIVNSGIREVLVESTENDGEWEWSIPTDQGIDDFYVIDITGTTANPPTDESNAAFSIIAPISYTEYTIHDIQYSTDGPSPHADEQIMTTGVVTAIFASTYFIQDGQGAWNGICVFDTNEDIAIGDKVTVKATVAEYNDKTELADVAETINLGQFPIPNAESITTADLATMEEYEGVLVKVNNVTVTNDSLGYGEWEVTDDSATGCRVDDLGEYTYQPVNGDSIYSIMGVVEYSYGNFKLEPRNDDDFDFDGVNTENSVVNAQNISIDAYPNPFIQGNAKSNVTVKYNLSQPQNISLCVYNIKGQLVKNLYAGYKSAGSYKANWNGMDNNGNNISAGVYFYKLSGKNISVVKKVLVLK